MRVALTMACITLAGCAVIAGPDYYKNTPTSELCRLYLTLPSYNFNHPARARELARRGESCGSHAEVAAAQREADQRSAEAIRAMQPPPAPPPRTHSYMLNGRMVTCTTVGNFTSCN